MAPALSRCRWSAWLCRDARNGEQKLANDLVASGYVTLLVDSFATRGIDHLCTYSAVNISRRMSDAYGALAFLARQSFVDMRRVPLSASRKVVRLPSC